MPRHVEFLVGVFLVAACLRQLPALAGDAQSVLVQVRVIKGSQPLEAGSLRKFEYDKRLEDLRPELTRLRYGSFSLLAVQKKVVQLAHRETIQLADGETLTLRPHYMDAQKIGMWLKWAAKTGAPVLDTRLHIDTGRNILVEESREDIVPHGASCADKTTSAIAPHSGTGMILAISVAPAGPED